MNKRGLIYGCLFTLLFLFVFLSLRYDIHIFNSDRSIKQEAVHNRGINKHSQVNTTATAENNSSGPNIAIDSLIKNYQLHPEDPVIHYDIIPGAVKIEQPEHARNVTYKESPNGKYGALLSYSGTHDDFTSTLIITNRETSQKYEISVQANGNRGCLDQFTWLPDESGIIYLQQTNENGNITDADKLMAQNKFALNVYDIETMKTRPIASFQAGRICDIRAFTNDKYYVVGSPSSSQNTIFIKGYDQSGLIKDMVMNVNNERISSAQILPRHQQIWIKSEEKINFAAPSYKPGLHKSHLWTVNYEDTKPIPKLVSSKYYSKVRWDDNEENMIYSVLTGNNTESETYIAKGGLDNSTLLFKGMSLPDFIGLSRDSNRIFFSMPPSGLGVNLRSKTLRDAAIFEAPIKKIK